VIIFQEAGFNIEVIRMALCRRLVYKLSGCVCLGEWCTGYLGVFVQESGVFIWRELLFEVDGKFE
jgi:hypothetical protein